MGAASLLRSPALAFLLVLIRLSVWVAAESLENSGSWPFRTNKCLYDDREQCDAAVGGRVCRWCDVPLGCFPLDRLDELGSFCDRVLKKAPSLEIECESVASKEGCLSLELCRWCTSAVVHDACFGMVEARRLPHQVFNCSLIPDYYTLS